MSPYQNIWSATPFGAGAAQQNAGMPNNTAWGSPATPNAQNSLFNNRMASYANHPLGGKQQFGGGVMPGQWPGYQLPTMGNIRNPFQYGNQPINPVGDVLGGQPPAPGAPGGGMNQQAMDRMMWMNKNVQDFNPAGGPNDMRLSNDWQNNLANMSQSDWNRNRGLHALDMTMDGGIPLAFRGL